MRPAVARRCRRLLTTVLLAVAVACSDDTTIGPGGIVLVRVVPDNFQLAIGKSRQIQGFPLDEKGGFVANRKVTWQTSDATVATVASDGTVTAVSIGTVQVTASAGGVSGTASVTVSPAPSIGLSADSVVLQAVAGSGATPSGSVAIGNVGGVTLDSMALGTITFTQGGATGWLTASLNQPTAPATLSLSVSTVGLALGTYSATVPITAPSADNSPQTVTVVVNLTPGPATTMALQAGNNQTATVNATVATAPAVLITDQFGNPVPGQAVTFAVTAGGGSVTGGSAVSGTNGIAVVTSWRLGTAAGNNGLSATAAGLAGSPVSFTATAVSAGAAQIAVNAGNGQTAIAGQNLATPPSVLVTDQFGNPVSGVGVTFAVASGGGAVIGAAQTTNASGIATAGGWTLGTTAGPNSMTATASGIASPVTFTATGVPGPATTMAITAGNNQTATAGTTVATAPAVKVTDANGNGVTGVAVTFAVATGGGSITGGNATSGAGGVASVGSWRLGGPAGANTLTATSAGLSGSPATFSATGTTGPAAIIAVSAGNNQAASAGSPVPIAPAVIVTDINGNPVGGIGVSFAVATGGGSITGAAPTTNAQGIAAVGSWTLGVTAGPNSLTATSGGLTGSPVTFTATGNPGNAATMALNGGSGQTGTVGGTLATAISVLVTDNLANPVQGVTVSWAAANGGSVNCGAGNVPSCSSLTGVTGIAQANWTLGTAPGTQSATGSVGGLAGSPVNFTATANVGPATAILVNAGNNQTATVNTAVATAPSVLVTDQFGNPVSGIGVTFTPTAGSGSVVGGSQTTVNGIATVGSWTLGTTAGTDTLTVSAAGVGSVVKFIATGTAGLPTQILINAGNNQSRTVNTAVLTPPSVVIRDGFNNPVGGVSVTFTPIAGGGSVTGGTQSSNAVTGVATVTSWTLGTVAGVNNNTLQATAGGVGSVNFSATATAGSPTSMAINSSNPQSATVGTAVGVAPSVIVRDLFSNVVPGATVTWLVTGGGGSVNVGAGGTTGAGGTATVTSWTVGTVAGASNNTLQASVAGAGSVSFTASATPGVPASVTINSTNNQTVRIGNNVPSAPSVVVRDAFSNFVTAGTTVSWAILAGGGSFVLGTGGSTNASGVATLTSWTIQGGGTVNGNGTYTNQIRATAGAVSNTITAFGVRTYSGDIVPLMTANSQGTCQSCHILSFTVYSSITGPPSQDPSCALNRLIVPGDTTSSLLYRKVQHTQPAINCGGGMPAIAGTPFLTAAERNVIRDWILTGAPNN